MYMTELSRAVSATHAVFVLHTSPVWADYILINLICKLLISCVAGIPTEGILMQG